MLMKQNRKQQRIEINRCTRIQGTLIKLQEKEKDFEIRKALQKVIDLYFERMEKIDNENIKD